MVNALSLTTLIGSDDVHVSAISIAEQGLSEAPLNLGQVILALLQHFQAERFSEKVSRPAAAPRRLSINHMNEEWWLHFAGWTTAVETMALFLKHSRMVLVLNHTSN